MPRNCLPSKSAQRGTVSLSLSPIASSFEVNGSRTVTCQSLATSAQHNHGPEWASTSTLTQTQSTPRASVVSPPALRVHRSIGVPKQIQYSKSIRQVRNLVPEGGNPLLPQIKVRDLWGGAGPGTTPSASLPLNHLSKSHD